MINEIKQNIVISNQISADVGISIHKNKKDPVPIIERKPIDFFMNETFKLDDSQDSDKSSRNRRNPAAAREQREKVKLKN